LRAAGFSFPSLLPLLLFHSSSSHHKNHKTQETQNVENPEKTQKKQRTASPPPFKTEKKSIWPFRRGGNTAERIEGI
jgi:hypothetical protein